LATWRSGYAAACKAVYTGSIPVVAFPSIPPAATLIAANQSQPALENPRPVRLILVSRRQALAEAESLQDAVEVELRVSPQR
jgi:hypothetical protein